MQLTRSNIRRIRSPVRLEIPGQCRRIRAPAALVQQFPRAHTYRHPLTHLADRPTRSHVLDTASGIIQTTLYSSRNAV